MPGVDTDDQRHRWWPQAGLWVGVGLAPLAAVLLLVGGAGQRLGGALGVLAVAVIGLSVALRTPPAAATGGWDDRLFDEFDAVRAELRAEIANAAQANQHAVSEQLMALHRQLAAIRAEQAGLAETPRPASSVTGTAGVSAAARVPAHPGAGRPGGPAEPSTAPGRPRPGAAAEPLPVPTSHPVPTGGVYRHTETVQVTRSTYVDGGVAAEPAESYPDYREPDDRVGHWPAGHQDWDGSHWGTRERDRGERDRDRRARPTGDDWSGDRWSRGADGDRWQPDPERRPTGGVDQWAGDGSPEVTSGQRWASVRTTGDAREFRFGERRMARHRDGPGDEVRIEDRWAAVRQLGPGGDGPRHAEPAALPPGGDTSWDERWEQAAPSPRRGHRYRESDEPSDRAFHRREYEFSDERWR